MFEFLEGAFIIVMEYSVLALEIIGAVIILIFAVRALACIVRDRNRAQLMLAEGIATGLSFLLAGEVLKTIIAPNWQDIGKTCAIFAIRALMSLLLHWETKHHKHES